MKKFGYLFLALLLIVFAVSDFFDKEYVMAIIDFILGTGNMIIFFVELRDERERREEVLKDYREYMKRKEIDG